MSTRPTDRAESDRTAARPTLRVGSAERALQGLNEAAAADIDALLKAEIERCREVARQALAPVKSLLAEVERSCDATMASRGESQAAAAAFVGRIVAAATSAAEAATQRARAEGRAEVEKVQAALAAVQAELTKAREQLETLTAAFKAEHAAREQADASVAKVREQLEAGAAALKAEQSARTNAEAELKAARDAADAAAATLQTEQAARLEAVAALAKAEEARQQLVSKHVQESDALRAELARHQAETLRLQQQAEAEKAERLRLVTAIQRAVGPGEIAAATASPTETKPAGSVAAPRADGPAAASGTRPAETKRSKEPEAETDPPEMVAYIEHLLKTLETMYDADVAARRNSADLVNRLTQNLRSARTVFRNHIGAGEREELTLFDRLLSKVLDDPEDNPFARHLGIASYECLKAEQG